MVVAVVVVVVIVVVVVAVDFYWCFSFNLIVITVAVAFFGDGVVRGACLVVANNISRMKNNVSQRKKAANFPRICGGPHLPGRV